MHSTALKQFVGTSVQPVLNFTIAYYCISHLKNCRIQRLKNISISVNMHSTTPKQFVGTSGQPVLNFTIAYYCISHLKKCRIQTAKTFQSLLICTQQHQNNSLVHLGNLFLFLPLHIIVFLT
jgi:hypothetical protein